LGGDAAETGAAGADGDVDVQPAMMAATLAEMAASNEWRKVGIWFMGCLRYELVFFVTVNCVCQHSRHTLPELTRLGEAFWVSKGNDSVTTTNTFLVRLADEDAILITVHASRGSVPREVGAWMAVFAQGSVGTIGGGHLELSAMAEARQRLLHRTGEPVLRYALGPALAQCCGGEVHLRFEPVSAAEIVALQVRLAARRYPVALFGGGHVGHALVRVLARLPLRVSWIDSRDEIFPADLPPHISCEHSDPVQAAVNALASGSRVLIMNFSHAQDLDVVAACLARQRRQADLPYVGLIGSQTKWATFGHRLETRGFTPQELAHITCPIGVPGIAGKDPEVIAVAVAAQILQTLPAQR
jgi:xanthine dehydrogenase accessory factor